MSGNLAVLLLCFSVNPGAQMEKMPYQPDLEPPARAHGAAAETTRDWRQALPVLSGRGVTLRELQPGDAASLFAMLTSDEVGRFISPPPTTAGGFEPFVARMVDEREAGNCACFAVVPDGFDTAIGLFQVRKLEPGFGTGEWGFAIGCSFWGTGIFMEAARLMLDFVFDVVGVHRLEARAALPDARGNGALRKTGALQEGVLRRSLLRNGEYCDQMLWTLLLEDWLQAKAVWGGKAQQVH
jgi:ribosomal-protein-alanine N-acetyltransferase